MQHERTRAAAVFLKLIKKYSMNDRFYIGVYWGARKQSILESAESIFEVYHSLTKIDKIFDEIAFIGKKEKHKINFKEYDYQKIEDLANLILYKNKKQIEKYNPGKIVDIHFSEPVGFVTSYEIPYRNKSIDLYWSAGSYSERLTNSLIIDFPKEMNVDTDLMEKVFTNVINCLKPKWGVVLSRKFESEISKQDISEFFIGWMNYFSKEIPLPLLPSGIIERPINQSGVILITTQEKFDYLNEKHTKLAMSLIDVFRENNIKRRIE
jgi:hypothetical protein